MSNVNPSYNDRVRYTLQYKPYGSMVIQEPVGWRDDDKEIARNDDYHGIFAKFSNSLQFVGNGADFILAVDEIYGVNANIRLIKDEKHPTTDEWEQAYTGFLDLSTMEIEKSRVSVKFNSGGLEQMLKARESESVELERLTTMDGKAMSPLKVDTVNLSGRKILLNSLFKVEQTDKTAGIYVNSGPNSGGVDRTQSVGVPIILYSKSHEEAQSITPETHGVENTGTTGIMFFANSPVSRSLHIKITCTFTSNVYRKDDVNHGFWGLYIGKYGNGTNYNIVSRTKLFSSEDNGGLDGLGGDAWLNPFNGENGNPSKTWSVTYEADVPVGVGESLSLEFYSKSNIASSFHDGSLGIRAENISCSLQILENSFYEQTNSKFILAYELASRLVEIMTNGTKNFKSNFFGRPDLGYPALGRGAYMGFTHGFWVRGFDSEPPSTEDEINSFKQLTTSFKDFTLANQAIWNIGLGIETIGYKEQIVIEDLKYFYSNQVTVRLPNQIEKSKYSVATKYYYSGIEIGYAKGGDYEEAMGLDEYNAKTTFTTVINRIKSVYSKMSPYRGDSYGKEFARRKSKVNYPTQDTQYDDDIFVMDLKPTPTGVFKERLWQDDFEQAPTGTYSPETATNLRFSPVNMLLRHGWFFGSGFTKYLDALTRYGSSTANSALTTKAIGGQEYSENGDIVNSEFEKARFVPQYVEFEHEVTTELMQLIEGTTVVQGVKIPNVYGLFEFTDENNVLRKGYLINLKPNDNKFKLLIANR